MEGNPYFPSLKYLAEQTFALQCSIFSENTRILIYSNEDIWQQVWSALKRYNRINDRSFAALLNVPLAGASEAVSTTTAPSKPSNRKFRAPKGATEKYVPKTPSSGIAAPNSGDGAHAQSQQKSSILNDNSKHPDVANTSERPRNPSSKSPEPNVDVLDVDFAIRELDLSDLGFLKEDIIVQAIKAHGSSIKSLNLSRCYQISLKTARAIRESNMPLSSLTLTGCRTIADEWAEIVLPCLASLESLDLGIADDEDFENFERYCTWDATHKEEVWSPPKSVQISPGMIAKITRSCPNLTHLNMSGIETSGEAMKDILSAPGISDRLVSLWIAFCDAPVSYDTLLELRSILPLVTNLRHLKANLVPLWDLLDYYYQPSEALPENLQLRTLAPNLETLALDGTWYRVEHKHTRGLSCLRDLSVPEVAVDDLEPTAVQSLTRLATFPITLAKSNEDSMFAKFFSSATNLKDLRAPDVNLNPILQSTRSIQKGSFSMIMQSWSENVKLPFMREIAFVFHSPRDSAINSEEFITQVFPYLESLKLEGAFARNGQAARPTLPALLKFPFLKKLHISAKTFVLDSRADLQTLSALPYLEELFINVAPQLVAPFFASRHKFSRKLRRLGLSIAERDTFFPSTLDVKANQIPEWRFAAKDELKDGEPLFPSLVDFGINKICCHTKRLWNLLATHICPNIHRLRLTGDIAGENINPQDFDSAMDFSDEEAQAEELSMRLLKMFKGVTELYLVDCWIPLYVEPEDGPSCTVGYIANKHKFLEQLQERQVAAFVRFMITPVYGYEATVVRVEAGQEDSQARRLVYI